MNAMHTEPLKARVINGRLVLDEPTDLPEGREVYLSVVDEGDDLDDEERAALHASIERSVAQAQAGELIDGDVVMAKLRAKSQ
jgi:hypothetical protein